MRDSTVDLWAEDEVHFQQHGSRCRMWIPPEIKDPVLFHEPTRKSVGYFGAVRLRDGKFVRRREEEMFNAETFWAFLKQLKKVSLKSGRRVVVILDNARYHHAKLHKEWRELNSGKFALSFLPAYSPELNPIERVWKLTRRKRLHNRHFEKLKSLIEGVEAQFDEWSVPNQTLRKLCAIT
jgi:transposase